MIQNKFSTRSVILLGSSAILTWSLPIAARANADNAVPPAADVGSGAAPAAEAADRDTTLVVTGIRGKPRTIADSPAPIDVIQGDQVSGVGRSDIAESLSHLLPSIGFGSTEAGVNSIVRPIFNRGLGPAYTLVLVNGKRRHNGALLTNGGGDTSGINPVDFDQLSLSSIKDIEILKDSAAAQYGSDAVAGVVNIELKRQDHGIHAEASGGSLYGGQGDLQTYKAAIDAGFSLGGKGFIHVFGDVRHRGLTWQNFFATQLPYAPVSNPKNAQWNGDGAHNGDPGIKSYSLGYNAELPVGDAVTAYSFATFGQRSTVIGNNYRRPDSTADFASVFPNGYYPFNNTAEVDYQIAVGAKGAVGQTHWDLSTTYGRDWVRQYSTFTINPSLGPTSPTSFDHLATYQFQQYVTNLDLTRAIDAGLPEPIQVSGGLEWRVDRFSDFAGDPLAYANGGYVFKPGDQEGNPNVGSLAAIGAQAAVTLSPADVVRLTRSDVAGYLDLGVTPVEHWYLGAAVRVEHYDDSSGTTEGYKFNSRYDFTPWLALRGTVGSGFRAPSLTQIGYSQTDNRTGTNPLTGAFGPSYTKLARTDSALAIALGAQPLKPEKSTNLGLGVVLRPANHFDLTVDAYQISIKHRIIRTGTLLGPDLAPVLAANGLNAATWVDYFANAVDTRTRGLDVVADYQLDLAKWGKLNLDASFNYNHAIVSQVANAPPALAALQALGNSKDSLVFVQRANIGDLTVNLPQTKLILATNWKKSKVSVNFQVTRYGSYQYVRDQIAADDRTYGAKWLTDIEVGVDVLPHARLSVGASNLFNVHPDRSNAPDAGTGSAVLVYGPAPFSLSGGYYFGKVSIDF
jgi:iron complex outermembrane receptor protein